MDSTDLSAETGRSFGMDADVGRMPRLWVRPSITFLNDLSRAEGQIRPPHADSPVPTASAPFAS